MYRIIGADGQPYGPASAEQLRKWLAERRVNAQTLAQLEGTQEWKPLASFPDFAADLRSAPPVLGVPPGALPATGADPRASNKIAAGICGILLGALGVHKFILGYTGTGLVMLLVSILTCGIAAPVMGIIGLIEGVMYLTKSDAEFVRTYIEGRKEWF